MADLESVPGRGALARWLAAAISAVAVIWALSVVFTGNSYPRSWSDELERNTPEPGWVYDERSEGWARTRFGELGISGYHGNLSDKHPRILIWGDSFVQAFQVADGEKMTNQLATLLGDDSRLGKHGTEVLAAAQNGWSVADFVSHLPVYESAVGTCVLNVIHMHTLEDIYPDRNPEHRLSLFLSEPTLRFERYDNEYREVEGPEHTSRLNRLAFRYRGQFFLKTGGRLLANLRGDGLRFSVGRQGVNRAGSVGPGSWGDLMRPDWADQAAPVEAWRFALDTLRQVSRAPVVIVYVPATPSLHHGELVTSNPEAELLATFALECERAGVHLVDAGPGFEAYSRENPGRFPRGFQNSRPWEGHYNAAGHRLVAEALHHWVEGNHHVVYPD